LIPHGILGWSHEVSVIQRDDLTVDIRKSAKAVSPEEQIPEGRMPLALQAAQKSPLIAVSNRLIPKLVEAGLRVHTIGVDRVTSSFYYLAEGGGEDPIRCEGDLVAAVGTMLGDRAETAAIERVLDGLVDRLLRALSRNRVCELDVELAAALPRAAADGSGLADVNLERFEKELSELVNGSTKYVEFAEEIAAKLTETNDRRFPVPLFGAARKVPQGPFDLTVGQCKVSLPTYERWIMATPLTEPAAAGAPIAAAAAPPPKPAPISAPPPAARAAVPASTRPPAPAMPAASREPLSRPPSSVVGAPSRPPQTPQSARLPERPKVTTSKLPDVAEKAAAEKAAAEKAAAEKLAAEKAAADKLAAEKAAAEKVAAEKAAADKLAAEKAAAEKVAAEKAAAEKVAAEKAAAEKAAAEKAAEEAKQTKGGELEKATVPQTNDGMLWIMLAVVVLAAAALAIWQFFTQK